MDTPTPPLDPEIVAIKAAMDMQGKKPAALGRLIGLDSSQVNRLLNGRRKLQAGEARKIHEWLGGQTPQVTGSTVVPMPGMVPLFGWVGAASESRLTFAEQNIRGYVPMHPAQMHVREPFALEVADISMIPRYEPGEIVYIAPYRFPAKEQDCVTVTADGGGYLKRFISRDSQVLRLWQLNPAEELTFPLSDVSAVHAVVGRG
jgi:SOS-response transcriptional repressor LexA